MNPITIFEISIDILLLGAIVTALFARKRNIVGQISALFSVLASIGLLYTAIQVFLQGPITADEPLFVVPGIGSQLLIQVDYLSAFFLFLIAILGTLSSLYAVKFMTLPIFKELSLGAYYPFALIFMVSISCLVTMADLFFFFIFWELMTLTSYTLVIFNKDNEERLRAGFKYFFMTHVATALMFIGSIIVFTHSRSFAFADLGASMAAMATTHPGSLHLALAFFFIGFATKAGILPFGSWLPDAYPAAPAPAAATFGGIMSKLGIFGLIKVFFSFTPIESVAEPWGIIFAIFGTISIFIGSLTALTQDDSKKLLAFSVVGQMGYILLGVGISLYFMPTVPTLGTIALIATLFHLMNNVLFKSCLFYNAGSIYYKTGARDLNEVGGLAQIMPLTAFTAVIAALSMAGMPLLSGFSSKWLFFQTSIDAGTRSPFFMIFAVIALFISVVTLAYSIKFFGPAFFGKFNPGKAKKTDRDVPTSMAIPQLVMAILCIVFGILPMVAVGFIGLASSSLLGDSIAAIPDLTGNLLAGLNINFGQGIIASWNPIVILIGGLFCLIIALLFFRAGGASVRVDETWYCGEKHLDEEVRYKAHGFYLAFLQFFGIRIGKYESKGVYPKFTLPKIRLSEQNVVKRIINIDNWFFYPITRGFMQFMHSFSATHAGLPQIYLLWLVVGALIAVLVLFALSAG